jgi:lysine 2,3-aminomutase
MGKTATLRTPRDLATAGLISSDRVAALEAVAQRYSVAIPPAFAKLINRNDPHDPIARQFVPDLAELQISPGENADPIGDHTHSPVGGVVHRYPDRVLLKVTHTCAVYCRFCFRREMVGPDGPTTLSGDALDRALAYVAEHPEIWEVILTGGDPLVLSPRRLREILRTLGDMPHVKVMRIHTRMPVAEPEAITPELVSALKLKRKPTYVAVHVNQVRELTRKARAALARLADAGLPLVSQSVLLKGVNDTPEALEALFRSLVEARVKPYYLHHADLAPGTAHLRTDIATGKALMRELRGRMSGLCQPAYVLDIPGGLGKVPVGPCYLIDENGSSAVEDPSGAKHVYPPQALAVD